MLHFAFSPFLLNMDFINNSYGANEDSDAGSMIPAVQGIDHLNLQMNQMLQQMNQMQQLNQQLLQQQQLFQQQLDAERAAREHQEAQLQ